MVFLRLIHDDFKTPLEEMRFSISFVFITWRLYSEIRSESVDKRSSVSLIKFTIKFRVIDFLPTILFIYSVWWLLLLLLLNSPCWSVTGKTNSWRFSVNKMFFFQSCTCICTDFVVYSQFIPINTIKKKALQNNYHISSNDSLNVNSFNLMIQRFVFQKCPEKWLWKCPPAWSVSLGWW